MNAWVDRNRPQRYAGVTVFLLLAGMWALLNVFSAGRPHPDTTIPVKVFRLTNPGGSLSIDDVVHMPPSRFQPDSSSQPELLSAQWFRFDVPRNASGPLVLFLTGNPDEADLYFRRSDGSYGVESFGERVPFTARRFDSPFVADLLTGTMLAKPPLYLRTYGGGTPYRHVAPVALETIAAYDRDTLARSTGSFAFVGFFAAMALVSVFLGLYLRERMFGLHALLMVTVVFWDLTEKQLAWRFIWPFASVNYATAENVTFVAYLFALLLFARAFLSLDKALPTLDRVLWVLWGTSAAFTFANPSGALADVQSLVQVLPFAILPVAGAIRWRGGFPQARFFVMGFAGLFVIIVTAMLFPESSLSPWAIDTGVACESLFFQFAIADRMLSVIRERDRAQRDALAAQEQLSAEQSEAISGLKAYNEAFVRFVPNEFLTHLGCENAVSVKLGDSAAEVMTVLFADIRGFTKLAEGMSPQKTFAFINEYLARVAPVIRAHNGFVDKYVGDGIIALFPGDADDAVDAAIELHQTVRRFNEARARSLLPSIAIGVGLHRGPVMLGTIGEEQRFETTVISDAVNVASRLEAVTKTIGAHVAASADAVHSLKARTEFQLRPLCPVQIRGSSRSIELYEVCDADEPDLLLHKIATLEVFESAMRAYIAGDFTAAERLFQEVRNRNAKDVPAAYFAEQSRLRTAPSAAL